MMMIIIVITIMITGFLLVYFYFYCVEIFRIILGNIYLANFVVSTVKWLTFINLGLRYSADHATV